MTFALFIVAFAVNNNAAAAENVSDRTVIVGPFIFAGVKVAVKAADVGIVAVFTQTGFGTVAELLAAFAFALGYNNLITVGVVAILITLFKASDFAHSRLILLIRAGIA